ncbi:MAG: hypothetical protein HYR88_12815 [Verrucomicrobia bacterium]|nr:hypothetical protein [Verrucomicrobiota bacterium]MBI3867626.1 hypothetical protein [Verrucomicrobiota bacterium]
MRRGANRRRRGFTLAEALAALAFLAIVIPVAVEGVRVANRAGQVAERKQEAARAGARIMGELVATKQWQQSATSGTTQEGRRTYRWQIQNKSWDQDAMQVMRLDVFYVVQGQEYSVRLSTLVDSTQ